MSSQTLRRVEAEEGFDRRYTDVWNRPVSGSRVTSTGRCERNPAADLRGGVASGAGRDMAAVANRPSSAWSSATADYQGSATTRAALLLFGVDIPATWTRPCNPMGDLDLEGIAMWTIPAAETKRTGTRRKITAVGTWCHSKRQVVQVLRALQPDGSWQQSFPVSQGAGSLHERDTVNVALAANVSTRTRTAPIGFRSTAAR